MLNDEYNPRSENEEDIVAVLKDEGRLRPMHIAERVGKTQSALNHYVRRLTAAGWVVEPQEQMYELAYDPRDMSLQERAKLHRDYADALHPNRSESNTEE